jgi:hypothetical protein
MYRTQRRRQATHEMPVVDYRQQQARQRADKHAAKPERDGIGHCPGKRTDAAEVGRQETGEKLEHLRPRVARGDGQVGER